MTAFDRNPLRRSYFEESDIAVAEHMRGLEDFDVLIEATGDPEVLRTTMPESGADATILLLGIAHAQRDFMFESILGYDKTVIGSVGSNASDFEEAIGLLPQLELSPYLQCVFPLEQFWDAWAMFQRQEYLKVLLRVD